MTVRAPRSPGALRSLVTAAVLAASVAAAGCGVAHPGITNGAVSGCFKALPAARAAVHDPGAHLLGVHRLPADAVPARLKSQPSTPGEIDTTVCAVAFKGPFSAGQVAGAAPGAYGRYAVVLVNATKLTVLRSYVGDRLPRNLKGRTL